MSGGQSGWTARIRAAPPLTSGAAALLPLATTYWSPSQVLSTHVPGAVRATAGPKSEYDASVSSPPGQHDAGGPRPPGRPSVSTDAETAMTSGKPDGLAVEASSPELPAEATVTTPPATMRQMAACSRATAS